MKYDHTDFTNNPKKYAMFKTAKVKNRIVNTDGTVEPDTIVGLSFIGVRRNQLYKRQEPVYMLTTGDCCYANNLYGFCL